MSSAQSPARGVNAKITYARRTGGPTEWRPSDPGWADHLDIREKFVEDCRAAAASLSTSTNGFVLRNRPSSVSNFFDIAEVRRKAVPETLELIAEETGTSDLLVIQTHVRANEGVRKDLPDYARRIGNYAFAAHVDADEATYRKWASTLLGPRHRDKCRTARLEVYNVWRPMEPVRRTPLAVCDASSLMDGDLLPALSNGEVVQRESDDYIPLEIHYFHLLHSPTHRWCYFPDMTPDEVLIFKQCESGAAKPRIVPHTAFEDPSSSPQALARKSIEVRVIAFDPPKS